MLDAASSRHLLVAWLSGGAAAAMSPRSPRGVKRRAAASLGSSGDGESSPPRESKRQASAASDIDATADLEESSCASSTASLAWSIDELVLHATSRGTSLDGEDPSIEVEAAACM